MEMSVKGGNNGNSANVDNNKRVHTKSVSEEESLDAAETGNAYNLNTGLITVSGDATLCYLKNTDPDFRDFVIVAVAVGTFGGITHDANASGYITIIDTPTGGDLISDATTAGTLNRNRKLGSSNEFEGVFYKGKVGGTATGGNSVAILKTTPVGRDFFGIDLIIKKNASIAITYTANLSSGSASTYLALVGYYKDKENI